MIEFWILLYIKPVTQSIKSSLADDLKANIQDPLKDEFPVHNVDVINTEKL